MCTCQTEHSAVDGAHQRLLTTVSARWAWPRRLPCRIANPDLWFAEAPTEVEEAKRLCSQCPVRLQCLAMALQQAEPWGVWGGELFDEGRVVPHKRGRGRPRKSQAA